MNAPLATAMAAAFRKVERAMLVLRPGERSFAGPFNPLKNQSGSQAALAAAQSGNVRLADELELAWRNAWRVLPSVPAAEQREQHGHGLDLMALSIQRNTGARGETLIEWSWVEPCPRCWRRLAARARCHKCSGDGHISGDVREIFYADLDGNVVEEQ